MLDLEIAVVTQLISLPLVILGLGLVLVERISPLTACRLVERSGKLLAGMQNTGEMALALVQPGDNGARGMFQILVISTLVLAAGMLVYPDPWPTGLAAQMVLATTLAATGLFIGHFCWRQVLALVGRHSITALGTVLIGAGVMIELAELIMIAAHSQVAGWITSVVSNAPLKATLGAVLTVFCYMALTVSAVWLGTRLGEKDLAQRFNEPVVSKKETPPAIQEWVEENSNVTSIGKELEQPAEEGENVEREREKTRSTRLYHELDSSIG